MEKKKEWIVPVTWEACGFIKVRADSALEAAQLVRDNPDEYPLPYDSEYVEGSFDISGEADEVAALTEIYTKEFGQGKWGQNMVFRTKEGDE